MARDIHGQNLFGEPLSCAWKYSPCRKSPKAKATQIATHLNHSVPLEQTRIMSGCQECMLLSGCVYHRRRQADYHGTAVVMNVATAPQPECDIYPPATPRVLVTNTLRTSLYLTLGLQAHGKAWTQHASKSWDTSFAGTPSP